MPQAFGAEVQVWPWLAEQVWHAAGWGALQTPPEYVPVVVLQAFESEQGQPSMVGSVEQVGVASGISHM